RVGDSPSNVAENRRRFFASLGSEPSRAAIPHQCHSDHIEVVTHSGEYETCDGLITACLDLPLVITIADCLPVVLFDPTRMVIANVHAGWRGSAKSIVRKAVETMSQVFGVVPGSIVAYLGPCAGPCCYEIGPEVARQFSREFVEVRGKTMYLDLKAANRAQLLESGVQAKNIEVADDCTICDAANFHSHRRDREQSGRMMAVVSLISTQGN
ncbi:MAG TPA: peptidoglycan editing factor PgeF, partial [Bacteroidota bacterium]|nr:peptidoglycan editing factor PgeF [Bacteroidota bacterium]